MPQTVQSLGSSAAPLSEREHEEHRYERTAGHLSEGSALLRHGKPRRLKADFCMEEAHKLSLTYTAAGINDLFHIVKQKFSQGAHGTDVASAGLRTGRQPTGDSKIRTGGYSFMRAWYV